VKAAVASRYGPPDVVTIADVPRPEPLDRIADAYRHVDAGHKKGTIVVTMS
jgi:D-arabinose 1-dehydrogenase-like Zn-dependent alcohol dehydrogenase